MGRYVVSFTTDTPISIHEFPSVEDSEQPKILRNEFIYTDQQIVVETYDNIVKHEASTSRKGLRIDVALDSADIVSSIGKAGGYADAIVSFLALCTLCHAPAVQFDCAYEITPAMEKREYLKDFYLEELGSLLQRKVEPSIFAQIFEAASNHEEKLTQVKTKKEWNLVTGLLRGVMWFRMGVGADSVIDEFIYYWLALEALDGLLPQKEGQLARIKCGGCKQTIDVCPHCGHDPRAFASASPLCGIEKLACDRGLSHQGFRDLVKLRAKIIHAGAPLQLTRKPGDEQLIESIRRRLPTVRNLVITGLGMVLELPSATTQRIEEHGPLKEGQKMRLRLRAYMQDFDLGRTSEGNYPIHPVVDAALGKLEIQSLHDGKYTIKGGRAFKPINFKWAADRKIEVELWGNVPSVKQGKISGKRFADSSTEGK